MKSFFHKINQILSGFCGWLMLAMMILLVVDICGRSVRRPLQGMAELSVFVMMIVIYLGLARCEEHREHVNLEIVRNALPRPWKRAVDLSAHLLAFVTVGFFFYSVVENALSSYRTNEAIEGTVELHIWPVKFVMIIGMIFFLFQTFFNMVDAIRRLKKPDQRRG